MNYYRSLEQENSVGFIYPEAPVIRYAWLEHEKGMWHLLTDLFADPEESARKWSDRQDALNELTQEGWSVVSSYPENLPASRPTCDGTWGYGLIWVGQ
jgi:hypothetical protein